MSLGELRPFQVERTDIDGLVIIRLKQVSDARGTVRELFRRSAMSGAGLEAGPWRQINITETHRGAIRGLHGETMTKLVTVVSGEAFGAYVDVRPDSATRGRTVTVPLRIGTQVLVPAGVCNGFQAVSTEPTQYLYCFDREWLSDMAGVAIHPLDPELGIAWPLEIDPTDPAMLSPKDAVQPSLAATLSRNTLSGALDLSDPHA
jgi:dTDP-4-dehydrorhamnose 3,5-epimerase